MQIAVTKRKDYIEWQDYFMFIAFLTAMRSKDPNTQVGACIVNDENKIVGVGYNGMPIGCSDDVLPWNKDSEKWLETKYPYVCCAELNAVLNKNSSDVKDCKLYVTLFPCNKCAKVLIQSGIKEVIYMSDKYHNEQSSIAARYLFNMAGVKLTQFRPKKSEVLIDLDLINGVK